MWKKGLVWSFVPLVSFTCAIHSPWSLRWYSAISVKPNDKPDYRNNPKYWDRQTWANSVDPDQTLQTAASDQGLHNLLLIQQYFRHINWQ